MNIKITYDWLLEYLETDADLFEIQKYLSLCGPSVEKVEKVKDDYLFHIEITSNRVDSASVFGIAQEAGVILPQFGKKARLKINPLTEYRFQHLKKENYNDLPLKIKINQDDLCSRFTAIVLKNVVIRPSPDFLRQRLTATGIQSINNVVDISNYLMIALGQPVHIFDYDTIQKQTMIMRKSRQGETIVTLDQKKIILPGGNIVIEDGGGKLIDLCGIMGGANSGVSQKTKNIVLFVQTYNKEKIRQTSMTTGQRTIAAGYFEKGLDEERVEPTLVYGVELLEKYAQAQPASPLYDIYPQPAPPKLVTVAHHDITRLIGVDISTKKITTILTHLCFRVKTIGDLRYEITVPSYRKNDIVGTEDIVEEIARIYGYNNLPSAIQITGLGVPERTRRRLFAGEIKIKQLLKNWGLVEMYNYSLISEEQIRQLDLKITDHLKIKNSLSRDIEYLRISLIPSLLKNIHDNLPYQDHCAFFELANVYLKKNRDLPAEIRTLAIAATTDFFDLKGILESLFEELNINNLTFVPDRSLPFLSSTIQTRVNDLGWIGQLTPYYQVKHNLKTPVFLASLDCEKLIGRSRPFSSYQSITPYAVIKLDLTLTKKPGVYLQEILDIVKRVPPIKPEIEKKTEIINSYQNKISLRFYFSSPQGNIILSEAKTELAHIEKALKE